MSDASPLDRLRRRYREVAQAPEQTFKVPVRRTADGDLVISYQEPDWDGFQEIKDRWASEDAGARTPLYAHAEVLAKACVDIYLRDDENGEPLKGLDGKYLPGLGLGEGPVGFHAAARALELTVSDAEPLTAVFALLASDWEVERHGNLVSVWEPSPSSPEVDDDFVGESEPAPQSGA